LSRGLGDVYKRQVIHHPTVIFHLVLMIVRLDHFAMMVLGLDTMKNIQIMT
jgi:hypothetical protein